MFATPTPRWSCHLPVLEDMVQVIHSLPKGFAGGLGGLWPKVPSRYDHCIYRHRKWTLVGCKRSVYFLATSIFIVQEFGNCTIGVQKPKIQNDTHLGFQFLLFRNSEIAQLVFKNPKSKMAHVWDFDFYHSGIWKLHNWCSKTQNPKWCAFEILELIFKNPKSKTTCIWDLGINCQKRRFRAITSKVQWL